MLLCSSFELHLRAADRGCEVSTRPSLRPLGLKGWSDQAKLGRIAPRGCKGVSARPTSAAAPCSVIASAAKQSRLSLRKDSGLLRCARNDDCGGGELHSIPVILVEASGRTGDIPSNVARTRRFDKKILCRRLRAAP